MSSLMSSKQKSLMTHEENYIKLLKQVTHLLLSQADQIKLFGCSIFKKVINKDDITVMLLRQSKLLSKNRPIDTFTPLPYKSNRKIKNYSEKKQIEKMRRAIVALRRLEYEKNLKSKSNTKLNKYILIQRYWREYFYKYYLPKVEMIQKNIRLYFQKKNKKITYDICYSQLELFYKTKNLISIGIQTDIKREKAVVTISSLYSKNVLTLLTKNSNQKIYGLRCLPQLKLIKEIDQKANKKHFKSSYISIQTSNTDGFSLYHNEKASDTSSVIKKNFHSPSSTNLFTNDTTIRSFRRDGSFLSKLILKRKKKPLYQFATKVYYSKSKIDEIDKKIRIIQRFIRKQITYDKVNEEKRVIYNNDDKLNKWISKITVQATRKIYMGEIKKKRGIKMNKKKIMKKVKGEQVFFTKENIKRKERKNRIKHVRVISLIKKNINSNKEDECKENKKLLKVLANCILNKATFSSKCYAFEILRKVYRDIKKEDIIRTEMKVDISKENEPPIEEMSTTIIQKEHSKIKDTDIIKNTKVLKSSKPINQKRSLISKKEDEEICQVNQNHNRTLSSDRRRQISIKLIKKNKRHQESLPTLDIDTILNSHTNDKSRAILLTSYINNTSLEKKQIKKPTHTHTISNIQIHKPTKQRKITKSKPTTQSMTNKELERLYKGIYSVRKDNPLYMLKKRNQSRPHIDSPLLLRDEMKDNLL